ncbi:MAG: sugar phosphate isomerase/epimerase family protein [Cyclobacteriaceae bacterium]
MNKREFLEKMALGGAAAFTLPHISSAAAPQQINREPMSMHVFSKHLQFLDYERMAETAAEIGFDGVDLTVRPGGHVLPENVKRDLPKAVAAIRKQGLQCSMITTRLNSPDGKVNQQVLDAAADQGIRYFRTDYFRYPDQADVPAFLQNCQDSLKKLADESEKRGLYASYQNHAGSHYMGAPVWDIAGILRKINSQHLGSQYDIRHATVEGGQAWPIGLNYIHPHINTLVMKDFVWEKREGRWRVVNTPIGDGMVNFPAYFKQLKALNVTAPVSVHFEYPMPEEDDNLSEKQKLEQTQMVMKKDLDKIRQYMKEAGLV